MSSPSNPQGDQPFPVPYLSTEVSDQLIQQILDAFNQEGLTSEQSRQLHPGTSARKGIRFQLPGFGPILPNHAIPSRFSDGSRW